MTQKPKSSNQISTVCSLEEKLSTLSSALAGRWPQFDVKVKRPVRHHLHFGLKRFVVGIFDAQFVGSVDQHVAISLRGEVTGAANELAVQVDERFRRDHLENQMSGVGLDDCHAQRTVDGDPVNA